MCDRNIPVDLELANDVITSQRPNVVWQAGDCFSSARSPAAPSIPIVWSTANVRGQRRQRDADEPNLTFRQSLFRRVVYRYRRKPERRCKVYGRESSDHKYPLKLLRNQNTDSHIQLISTAIRLRDCPLSVTKLGRSDQAYLLPLRLCCSVALRAVSGERRATLVLPVPRDAYLA
jgi:hypothetical protein